VRGIERPFAQLHPLLRGSLIAVDGAELAVLHLAHDGVVLKRLVEVGDVAGLGLVGPGQGRGREQEAVPHGPGLGREPRLVQAGEREAAAPRHLVRVPAQRGAHDLPVVVGIAGTELGGRDRDDLGPELGL
jgi:hypothetical protein